jgi:hypothetical protein
METTVVLSAAKDLTLLATEFLEVSARSFGALRTT